MSEEEIKKTVIKLADEKNKIHDKLASSQAYFAELASRKKNLELSLRKKIMKTRSEERKKRESFERDLRNKIVNARKAYHEENFEIALAQCEKILLTDRENLDALELIDLIDSRKKQIRNDEEIKRQLEIKKEQVVRETIIEARKMIRLNQYNHAIDIIEESLIRYGENSDLRSLLTETEKLMNEKNERIRREEEKKKELDFQENALIKIGADYFNDNLFEKARESFEKALKLNPVSKKALEGVVESEKMLLKLAGENKEREQASKDSLLRSLAKVDCMIAVENFDEALKLLESLINNSPLADVHKITSKINQVSQKISLRKKESAELENQKLLSQEEKRKKKNIIYLQKMEELTAIVNDGDYEKALYLFRMLLVEFPENEKEINDMILDLGEKIANTKKEKTLRITEEAIKRKAAENHLKIISSFIELKDFESARNEIAEARIKFSFLHDELNSLHERIVRYEEDIELLEKKENEKRLKYEEERRLSEISDLELKIRELVALNNLTRSKELIILLNTLVRGKDEFLNIISPLEELIKEKESLLDEANNKKQQEFIQKFSKGLELYKLGSYWDAFLLFKEANILKPEDSDVENFRNKCSEKLRKIEEKKLKEEDFEKRFKQIYSALDIKIKSLCNQGEFLKAYDECQNISIEYSSREELKNITEYIENEEKRWRTREVENKLKSIDDLKRKNYSLAEELYVKGKISAREGLFDDAFAYLYDALRIMPDNQKILSLIDEIENLKIRSNKMIREEKEQKESRKSEIRKSIVQAERYVRNQDFESALDIYERALELEPFNEYLIKRNREVEKILKDLIQRREYEKNKLKEKIDTLTIEASKKYYQGKFIEALAITSEILVLDPENRKIRDLELQIKEKKDLEERAEQERTEKEKELISQRKDKEELISQNRLAEIKNIHHAGLEFYRNSEYERAIEEWEKVKFVDPANAMVNEEIRRAKLKIKEMEISKLQEEEFAKQTETKGNHLWLEGRRFFREGEYSRAIECWEQGILLMGRERRFIEGIEKAQSLMKKQRHEETRLKLLKEKKEKSIQHFTFIANRYLNNGQYREAIKFFEQALAIDPENIDLKNGILNAEESMRISSTTSGDVELDLEVADSDGVVDKYSVDDELDSVENYDTLRDDEEIK